MATRALLFLFPAIAVAAVACQSAEDAPPRADGGVANEGGGPNAEGGAPLAEGGSPQIDGGLEPGDAGQIPGDTYPARACTGVATAVAVLCVDVRNETATADGTAAHPFKSVQAAIDAAKTGDVVEVAAGTYAGNVRLAAKSVDLAGGFEGATAAAYAAGTPGVFTKRDVAVFPTVLQGAGGDSVVHLANAGTSVVTGFRIRGGTGHVDGERFSGGGVFCEGGKPTLSFNVIEANDIRHERTMTRGGGVNVDNAEAQILYNVINGNAAMRGAGIAASGNARIVIKGNVVSGNVSIDDHGGGMFVSGKDVAIMDNVVSGNQVGRALGYGWGGGLYIHSKGTVARLSGNVYTQNFAPSIGSAVFVDNEATAYLDHELLYRNACPDRGGALYVDGLDGSGATGSTAFVTFTTIADNNCTIRDGIGAGGVYVEGDSKVTITDSILWGNGKDTYVDDRPGTSLSISYSLTSAPIVGTGNISQDPLFVDAANGDFHVRAKNGHFESAAAGGQGGFVKDDVDSPTLDVADPAEDFSRERAPNGGRANLGVHGNTSQASLSSK